MNDEAPMTKGDFWSSEAAHVACAPGEMAAGLSEFLEDASGRQGWCLFQTSGTEGRRKWVALTKEAILCSAKAVNAHYEITAHDHWVLALPTHHVGGFGILARAFVCGSAVTRLEGRWDAAVFARMCAEAGATLTSLVPTQVFDLVAAKISAPRSMRVVLVGGGALGVEIEAAALQLGWPVRRTYGMTETASQVASQRTADGGMEVLPIWNAGTDAEGVLTVRGMALAKGYATQREGKWSWEPISAADGLRTRDQVTLQHEGGRQVLRFVGRETGIVKILGELVALRPIQEQIDALRLKFAFSAGDAAVCELPDERKESRLVMAVSGMSLAQAEALQKGLNESLRPLERIEELRLVPVIPRGELGKIRLAELRALLL